MSTMGSPNRILYEPFGLNYREPQSRAWTGFKDKVS